MAAQFREFLERLLELGELKRVSEEVDLRQISKRVGESKSALWFDRVCGYEFGVVSGILGSRERMGICLGCNHKEIGRVFSSKYGQRHAPVMRSTAPVKERILLGADVDLTALPVPLISKLDGGPYITGGIGVSKDPEFGRNVGMYRLMIRNQRETSIDMVSASDLKLFYERAFKQGRPLPFAVAIGVHPSIMMGAAHMAAAGVDEYEIAGGLAGSGIDLVKCETVDLEVPADAEIVLEGEILPIGWTIDEGRFGDFTGFVGPVKWNPIFRVNAVSLRKDPIFYALHMPDEVDYLVAPPLEGSAWQALSTAGVTGRAVYAPQASGCNFHVYAAIKKRPGEGKNALLALLSLKRVKHVVVTDDDVDIFNPQEVERAIAYRVRPTRDVVILDGARGSHLDPSIQLAVGKGSLVALTGKWGVDATIPEGSDPSEYEEIVYPEFDELSAKAQEVGTEELAERIASTIVSPMHFYEIMHKFGAFSQQSFVRAWALLRERGQLERETASGKYLISAGTILQS